jgi:two-component system, LytTR family, response regulator
VTCVGECGGRASAVTAIVEHQPDVVLLDIQLGRRTAFEIIEEVGVDAMPLIVFVTAFDRHALKAFEVHALDYVLKPVDPERLREALDRAAALLSLHRGASLAERLEALLAERGSAAGTAVGSSPGRLVVRDGGRLAFVDLHQVDWFESDGNYVKVHSAGRGFMMRATMDRIAERVGGQKDFVRVRRSAIVNIRSIANMERYGRSAYLIRLRDGARIISSRHYHAALRDLVRGEVPRAPSDARQGA